MEEDRYFDTSIDFYMTSRSLQIANITPRSFYSIIGCAVDKPPLYSTVEHVINLDPSLKHSAARKTSHKMYTSYTSVLASDDEVKWICLM